MKMETARAVEWGDIEDFYPFQEAARKRSAWSQDSETWEDLRDRAVAAFEAGAYKKALRLLDDAAQVESAWGASPSTDAVRRALTLGCECGTTCGEACSWSGPLHETTVVEWMPEQFRTSHSAVGGCGQYPHNGAVRLRVAGSCAERLLGEDPEWVREV